MSEFNPQTTSYRKLWLAGLFLLLLYSLTRWFQLGEQLRLLQGYIHTLGYWGPVVFIGIYILATVALVPGVALTFLAAPLFGAVLGVVYVSIGSTVGAIVCFLIARYGAGTWVQQALQNQNAFRRLQDMLQQQGMWVVLITRLIPLFPFNLLNYGFGLTTVSLRTYALWSWLGMMPGTVLYVVGTDVVVQAIMGQGISWLTLLGLVVLVLGLVLISRRFSDKIVPVADKESRS